jgi:ketosteroid isomerase-like protein
MFAAPPAAACTPHAEARALALNCPHHPLLFEESMMSHSDTVKAMYQAFAAGDLPTMLSHVAPDVVWEYGPLSVDLPWLRKRHGHAGVREFMQSLADFEFRRFEPKAVLDGPDGLVVGIVHVETTLKRNGQEISEPDEVHLFHFDANGKLKRFRHQVDTHRMWLANAA